MSQSSLFNPDVEYLLSKIRDRTLKGNKFFYKPLPPHESWVIRRYYADHVPKLDLQSPFYIGKTKIAEIGSRVVVGDYGAYLELCSVIEDSLFPKFARDLRPNMKYRWMCARGYPQSKIYYQLRTVDYADYVVGRWYVNPEDVNQDGVETLPGV